MKNNKRIAAFSLVELSIVLVILGLLVGGVLSGRSLIRAAEMRNITSELTEHQTAVNNFRMRYNAVPGDMRNATQFWGPRTTPACYSGTAHTAVTGKETCNGDGDGGVGGASCGTTAENALREHEKFLFWQHLSNAGLIGRQFAGGPASSRLLDAGLSVPESKAGKQTVWRVDTFSNRPGCVSAIPNNDDRYPNNHTMDIRAPGRNFLVFGDAIFRYLYTADAAYQGLTAEEAYSIDAKIDDGLSPSGIVRPYFNNHTGQPTRACTKYENSEYSYNLGNSSTTGCILYFRDLF